MIKGIRILFFGALALYFWSLAYAGESDSVNYWSPESSTTSSSDVQYYGSQNAQTVTHKNVSFDDTRDNNNVKIQENTEFTSSNQITVLNNMGASASIYSAEDLDSKTTETSEKKGLVFIPRDKDALFKTSGTELVEPKNPRVLSTVVSQNTDADEYPKKDVEAPEEKGPRVLVS